MPGALLEPRSVLSTLPYSTNSNVATTCESSSATSSLASTRSLNPVRAPTRVMRTSSLPGCWNTQRMVGYQHHALSGAVILTHLALRLQPDDGAWHDHLSVRFSQFWDAQAGVGERRRLDARHLDLFGLDFEAVLQIRYGSRHESVSVGGQR
jgi:hypothetical protein